jgi:hypothetical protein
MGLEQPHVLGTEPVGWLPEIGGQFAHHTDVSTRSMLRVISSLSCRASRPAKPHENWS